MIKDDGQMSVSTPGLKNRSWDNRNKWGTVEYEELKKRKLGKKGKTDIEIIESAANPQPSAKDVANDIYKVLGDQSLKVLNKYNMFE